MPRTSDKRERLIRAADRLVLQQGCKKTTLADIAEASGVPLGNVYYYFKSKNDICSAVVDSRLQALNALIERCDAETEPRRRLLCFLSYPLETREDLRRYGCPFGSLASELSKSEGELHAYSTTLMRTLTDWSRRQFEAMGCADADELALQFAAALQGMSLLAHTLDNTEVIDILTRRLRAWIEGV